MCSELADRPSISLHPISNTIQEQGDALGNALSSLLDDGKTLGNSISNASDSLVEHLKEINNQFGVITNLLRDALKQKDSEGNHFEDISDLETGTQDTGCISNAHNTGTVKGNEDVAGIVGCMAIEYDFNPKDDLTEVGDRSLNFQYQTKAAVISSINAGEITGKEDYSGGIAGRMDLGRITACENYGTITSSNGNYVGGIAGASSGSIRNSWSKCHLSGADYLGGIAGLGSTIMNCHTLVEVQKGTAYLGAIAGDISEDGTVSSNTFTSETLAALDSVSYSGKAEPVSFDTLCTTSGVPEKFSSLELTFTAEGKTVAVIPVQYGKGLDSLPEIPAKKGYSASWPNFDYSHVTASQTLEAQYIPYSSALTDEEGTLPQILVDGSFSNLAEVSHTSQEVSWTDEKGTSYHGTAYTVTVKDPDFKNVSYTVHYRLADKNKRYALWVQNENGWSKQKYEIDGQYLLVNSQTEQITFCVIEQPASYWWIVMVSGGGAALLLIVLLLILRKHRKKHKNKFLEIEEVNVEELTEQKKS